MSGLPCDRLDVMEEKCFLVLTSFGAGNLKYIGNEFLGILNVQRRVGEANDHFLSLLKETGLW